MKYNEENNSVRMYGEKQIRTVVNPKNKKVWFCVTDVISAISKAKDPKDCLKKLRKRDTELKEKWGKIITFLPYKTKGGVQNLKFADIKGFHRITQHMLPKRAEPFREWMEEVKASL